MQPPYDWAEQASSPSLFLTVPSKLPRGLTAHLPFTVFTPALGSGLGEVLTQAPLPQKCDQSSKYLLREESAM